jgi:hypothetical protein
VKRLARWLATPFRAARALFPFTHEGRQTLVYLVFAGAGPALTLVALQVLDQTEAAKQWGIYASMARILGWSLLIIVCGLGMFVSIRAIKLGKDGFEASGIDAQAAAQAVATVAQDKADVIAESAKP